MYKIGDFSILSNVTIKTLRYYDTIDLFKPKIIDKFTGYRYYSDEQLEDFSLILKYKDLGFSLEEIKKLINNNDKNKEIKNKIDNLTLEIIENERKIQCLSNMLKKDNTNIRVEYKPYKEPTIIGKKYTIKNRNEIEKKQQEIKQELEKLNISYGQKIFCNFELGYEEENIDCLIGYTTSEDLTKLDLQDFIYLGSSPWHYKIIGEGKISELNNIYKNIILYANNNNIQIRDFYTERYNKETVEIYAEAFDLNEKNEEYEKHLNNYHFTNELDNNLVGSYQIREILPSMKYMANPKKQKSSLDTNFKELILNSDGTTNYPYIHWNKKELIMEFDNKKIPLPIYKRTYNNETYITILMNESYTFYESQRPIEYLYKKIK